MDYIQTLAQLAAEIAELRQQKCDLEAQVRCEQQRVHDALHDGDADRSRLEYMCEVIARLSDAPEIPRPEDIHPHKGLYARPNNGDPMQEIGGKVHTLPAYTGDTE
jgi:hypothetical protein